MPKRLKVLCEGPEDREVLGRLATTEPDLSAIEVGDVGAGRKTGGWTAVEDRCASLVESGLSVAAIIDLDDRSPGAVVERLCRALREHQVRPPDKTPEAPCVLAVDGPNGPARIGVVAVGISGIGSELGISGVARFAVDDYLLRMVLCHAVYEKVSELEAVPFDVAEKKLRAFVDRLRENGLAVGTTQPMISLFKGITNFRASPAELAKRLVDGAIKAGGPELLRKMLSPMADDLRKVATEILGRRS